MIVDLTHCAEPGFFEVLDPNIRDDVRARFYLFVDRPQVDLLSLAGVRWVLAAPEAGPFQSVKDLEGKIIATELVGATKRYLERHGLSEMLVNLCEHPYDIERVVLVLDDAERDREYAAVVAVEQGAERCGVSTSTHCTRQASVSGTGRTERIRTSRDKSLASVRGSCSAK